MLPLAQVDKMVLKPSQTISKILPVVLTLYSLRLTETPYKTQSVPRSKHTPSQLYKPVS